MRAVLALDQGTTSSRAILFDRDGKILAVAQREFRQYFPHSGWVEHDASEIWQSQLAVARDVLQLGKLAANEIAAIGITNQRETTVVWNRHTGQPIARAIVWQDRRTATFCDSLRDGGHEQQVSQRTGLVIDPYFSGTKLRWILDHVEGARHLAQQGDLAFGTIDCWLLWNLTGGRVHATDVSNASRTMLMNLETGQWDQDLLELLEIPRSVLPEICPSSHYFGETANGLFDCPIPLGSAAGDQQAALFGQNCTRHGMAKNTYGTGCFMLMNIGDKPRCSTHQLLTSVAWRTPAGTQYALEGSVFIAGAAVQWLRDGLGIIESAAEVEALAATVPDSDDVYLVPAFAGLGAPHWDAYARGVVIGITRGTTKAHFARAALEGIAFQVADVLTAMQQDTGIRVAELRVDGGAAANSLLMQFQADLLQAPVVRPRVIETTALGAAFLAGLTVGFWNSMEEIQAVWQAERTFLPEMSEAEANRRRDRWHEALQRSRAWDRPTS
ncbi:MAG: glycerol kinase GlpK [Planctomycetaceae bacterium]|nr:glycerol kinase GlpK [Planctomycetaceae bacterium]